MIARIESGTPVPSPQPRNTSAVVAQALSDAETLLHTNGPLSTVDRAHTALHGYLRDLLDDGGIEFPSDAGITQLFKIARRSHPALQAPSWDQAGGDRILRSLASVIDTLNTMRNRRSVAHPNSELLDDADALLAVNGARTILAYVSAKCDPISDGHAAF